MLNEIQKQLKELIEKSGPLWSAHLKRSKKLKYIRDYIFKNTEEFSDIPFKTRVYFILSGTKELAKCQVCGRILKDRNCDPINGFGEIVCCSYSCAAKHPKVQEKMKNTCLAKYGTEYPQQSKEFKDKVHKTAKARTQKERDEITQKRKETCLEKYGVEFASQSIEAKQKVSDNWKKKSSEEIKEIRKRIEKTNLEKYGTKNTSQNEEVKRKAKETWNNKSKEEIDSIVLKRKQTSLEKYGETSYTKTDEYKEKSKETNLKRYGETHYSKTEDSKLKTKTRLMEEYGKESFSQVQTIREKIDNTFVKKYGGKSPMCDYEIRKKARKKYLYDEIYFDSEPEVAYYIWLKDNGIKFEYHPKIIFEYEENGEKKKYFPDYLVENDIVEIKANYWWKTASEEKRNCILNNANKILFKRDYSKFIKYVNERFGKTFLKSLKQYKP